MSITRRDFFKGCATLGVLMVPALAGAAKAQVIKHPVDPNVALSIEKSIKAGFGGGFSLLAYHEESGQTFAQIEHSGNRYRVVSADRMDWVILSVA